MLSDLVRPRGNRDSAGPDVPGSVQRESFPVGVPSHFLWDRGSVPGTAQRGAIHEHGESRSLSTDSVSCFNCLNDSSLNSS